VAVYASLGVGFIAAIFGYPMTDVWIMMNSLQLAFLIPAMNLQLPTGLLVYIQNFQLAFPMSAAVAQSCFYGLSNHTYLQEVNAPPSYNYEKLGYGSTAFLQTSADILSILLYFFVINIVIEVFRMTYEVNPSINNTLNKVRSTIVHGFLQFAFIKLAFTSHLNLTNLTFADSQTTLSSLIAIGVCLGCYAYAGYLAYQARKFHKEIQVLQQNGFRGEHDIRDMSYYRGVILFETLSITDGAFPLTLYFPAFLAVKNLIAAIVMVTNNTEVQLPAFMFLNISSFVMPILIQPFNDRLLNWQMLVNEMGIFVAFMQAHAFIPRKLMIQSDQNTNGSIMVMILMFIVFLNAAFIIFKKGFQILKCRVNARAKPPQREIQLEIEKPEKPQQTEKLPPIKPKEEFNNDPTINALDSIKL